MDTLLGNREWDLFHGDCIPHMADMPESSVDFSIYSVPFPSLFAYTDSPSDMGNVNSINDEIKINFAFFFKQLLRVTKPGRATICHCMDVPRMKRSGEVGLADFPGILLRIAERAGFVWEYRWSIRKNPQAQAIRTRSRELQFAGLESDRAKQRGCLPDYLLKFRRPGENEVAINDDGKIDELRAKLLDENGDEYADSPGCVAALNQVKSMAKRPLQVSRNDWIKWAESTWDDINQQDTLNVAEARSENDVKHICPLQLEVYRRCILLFTNPGEIVFEPFTGIGSGGFSALGGQSPKTGKSIADSRRFYGCELKDEYFETAKLNLARAVDGRESKRSERTLFELETADV
jgi:DNA modification methylase